MEEIFFCPGCMAKAAPVDGKCPVCGCDVNTQNALHQLPVNTILNGRYIVGRVLGAGGFGITYIGYDLKLDGKVAIKEYYPSGAANRSQSLTVLPTTDVKGNPFEIGKRRFLKEARTLSEFVGEGNIVALRDYFEENGTAYIVMEYLEGEDLSHYAKEHGVFGMDEAFDLLEPAMLALDKIHKRGLIHRDISPSNIMVLSDGRVKVLDFGSARLQNASGELSLSIMLKPGYAPMEQYSTHGEQGSWTDVYAMSATIYKLITGKTPPASTDRLMEDTLEPPSKLGAKITPAQEKALLRGLALRPADRTQTMAGLAESLRGKKASSQKPDKKEKLVKEQEKKKPPKPAVDLKKKTAPAKPVKPAEENKKAEKPALPKKRLLIIAAVLLAVLVVCLTVPKVIDRANENNVEDVQDTHLAELAAAREAIAGHSETTISAGEYCTIGLKSDGTVAAEGSNNSDNLYVSGWRKVISVSAGRYFTVGLRFDGTVLVAGRSYFDAPDVSEWTGISAVRAGKGHIIGLLTDGTVIAAGDNTYGQCDVSDWADIVAIDANDNTSIGLKSDGTVVAVGYNADGQCGVYGWTDIIDVSTSGAHTVGLKSDGTVVAVGQHGFGQCDVSAWTDIVAVSAGNMYTLGLKSDGTVVSCGSNERGQCDISDWENIAAISAGGYHSVGLKADGTVVAVGENNFDQCDVSSWTDIKLPEEGSITKPVPAEQEPSLSAEELTAARAAIAPYNQSVISAGREHTAALRSDGTAAAVGSSDVGQCDVSGWSGLIAMSAGGDHTVGLRSDGTAVAVGSNYYGQCDVRSWADVVAVSAGTVHTVGLKSDGTVLAAGDNRYNQSDVSGWVNIIAISAGDFYTVGLKADGTVLSAGDIDYDGDLTGWTDIVAVSAGGTHTVGLKKDGTVVAAGSNACGQCDVSDWTDIIAVSAAGTHTIGLRADGTVIAVGDNNFNVCAVDGWHNIVAVSTADQTTMGLRSNGAVVIAGINFAEAPDWTDIALPE